MSSASDRRTAAFCRRSLRAAIYLRDRAYERLWKRPAALGQGDPTWSRCVYCGVAVTVRPELVTRGNFEPKRSGCLQDRRDSVAGWVRRATLDHVIPVEHYTAWMRQAAWAAGQDEDREWRSPLVVAAGATMHAAENLVTACMECNVAAGAATPAWAPWLPHASIVAAERRFGDAVFFDRGLVRWFCAECSMPVDSVEYARWRGLTRHERTEWRTGAATTHCECERVHPRYCSYPRSSGWGLWKERALEWSTHAPVDREAGRQHATVCWPGTRVGKGVRR